MGVSCTRGPHNLPRNGRWEDCGKIATVQTNRMAEPSNPIPPALADAFREAVARYKTDWSPSAPDLEVILFDQKLYSIRTICSFVTNFSEPMPDYLYHMLINLPGSMRDLDDQSYGCGARCLLALIRS